MTRTTLEVPMNRVEGDLEVRVEIDGGVVADAHCAGTMYRGFETILVGRAARDGLVIAPRVCGICSTSHLTAAVRALDAISGAAPPADAVRVRNVALMTEHLQSDVRQSFLMLGVDFASPAYRGSPLYDEAARRLTPFAGETVVEVLRETKKVLEIVALLGGQWPHSSFMVPGGVVSVPSGADLLHCRHLLRQYHAWYERRILGCTVERWRAVKSRADLEAWLAESDRHRQSDLGFFIRLAGALGLDRVGRGPGRFLSYGSLDRPAGTSVATAGDGPLVPAGVATEEGVTPFDPELLSEHVAHSWFEGEGSLHPSAGETRPYASGHEGRRYSWAKAPRYDGKPAETGPLAEAVVAGDPLFTELVRGGGPSVFARVLARIVRGTTLLPAMEVWLAETEGDGDFYRPAGDITDGEGYGLTHASRGALGHWVQVAKGKIERYQIISPTTWNASPRDGFGVRGPIEEALVGTKVSDPANPVELGHVVRSFDPCLVCTVHALEGGRLLGRARVGAP